MKPWGFGVMLVRSQTHSTVHIQIRNAHMMSTADLKVSCVQFQYRDEPRFLQVAHVLHGDGIESLLLLGSQLVGLSAIARAILFGRCWSQKLEWVVE